MEPENDGNSDKTRNVHDPGDGNGWRDVLFEVIFEADTRAGKRFDVALIVCIVLSVFTVMLDSVSSISAHYGSIFRSLEWLFTVLFTIEYVLRLLCVRRPLRYATSFFGVIDLLAIAPTYISLLFPSSRYLVVVRILRVLRVFRVFKLAKYLGEANLLLRALRASQRKITVFLFTVLALVIILGSLMYIVEGEEHGFTSIPQSIYWAIVTLTTVGYGDILPGTPLGRAIAPLVMICGYGIIAVPTGIVTVELLNVGRQGVSSQACPQCSRPKICSYT